VRCYWDHIEKIWEHVRNLLGNEYSGNNKKSPKKSKTPSNPKEKKLAPWVMMANLIAPKEFP
jgi:hypothetical protein